MYIVLYDRIFSVIILPTRNSVSFCPLAGGRSGGLWETYAGAGPPPPCAYALWYIVSHETSNITIIRFMGSASIIVNRGCLSRPYRVSIYWTIVRNLVRALCYIIQNIRPFVLAD